MPLKTKQKKSILEFDVSIGGAGLTQIAIFAKNLAVMLRSGLTVTEALDALYDSAQGRFKNIIAGVYKSVESGNLLSDSLARYPKVFSGLFTSTVYAGETSGNLEENLENLAEQLKKEKELISKIKGAMLYPMVILGAAFILGLAMAFLVLPKITPLFMGLKMDLPVTTRMLIWFSSQMQNHGLIIFIGLALLIALFIWLIKRDFAKPIIHLTLLKIPIIKSIVRNANLARICRTLGTLLKSGLNIVEALEITKKTVSNYYYRKSLDQACQRISKGAKLSSNLSQFNNLYPVMVTRMIGVGEKSGKLEETLKYLADFYDFEVDTSTKSLSTAIEPILLVIIGLVVGFLALSIITPIYNITGGISK